MDVLLGMPTLMEVKSIDETIHLCQELGLSFVELNMNMPNYCPEQLDPLLLKKASEDHGIGFTVHLPEEVDLASFHRSMREGSLQRCREGVEWASRAGAKLVNLHLNSGVYFTLPNRQAWVYEEYFDQFTSALVSSISELLDMARRAGIKVCVENAYNFHLPFIARAIDRLICMDGFLLTWDVGHDARTGFRETALLKRYESRIAHMHLHDFDGTSDHQPLYSGIVDVKGMLSFAGNRGIGVVVETKTVDALTESVAHLRSLGRA